MRSIRVMRMCYDVIVLIVMCRPNTGNHCGSRCRWTSTDYLGYRYRRLQVRQDEKAFWTVTTILHIPVQFIAR